VNWGPSKRWRQGLKSLSEDPMLLIRIAEVVSSARIRKPAKLTLDSWPLRSVAPIVQFSILPIVTPRSKASAVSGMTAGSRAARPAIQAPAAMPIRDPRVGLLGKKGRLSAVLGRHGAVSAGGRPLVSVNRATGLKNNKELLESGGVGWKRVCAGPKLG